MKWTVIGAAVAAILCFSSAFAGNGTIRLNVEKDWWKIGELHGDRWVNAKCWAEDGHATTHWEKVHPNSHKTCHGAFHMRVDFPPTLLERKKVAIYRLWRGSGQKSRKHEGAYYSLNLYLDCADDQTLKVTVRREGKHTRDINVDSRCE